MQTAEFIADIAAFPEAVEPPALRPLYRPNLPTAGLIRRLRDQHYEILALFAGLLQASGEAPETPGHEVEIADLLSTLLLSLVTHHALEASTLHHNMAVEPGVRDLSDEHARAGLHLKTVLDDYVTRYLDPAAVARSAEGFARETSELAVRFCERFRLEEQGLYPAFEGILPLPGRK